MAAVACTLAATAVCGIFHAASHAGEPGQSLTGRQASVILAQLAKCVEACTEVSRPVLLGSRDPKGSSCVQVSRTGDVQTTVPSRMGDLDGGPGTKLALLYVCLSPRAKTPMEDFIWHQGRLKTFLQNLRVSNAEPLRQAEELARLARFLPPPGRSD